MTASFPKYAIKLFILKIKNNILSQEAEERMKSFDHILENA